ncbi:hypothetical protein [Pedobacter duraquae]|uniref:Uncharacterized protein n=1 Tax=Pedobacter duraquae TaxID=425511 RepID=A0A4R6IP22_9SPHI|nr:hypothetical protein [Pedobacter duraquae]TDO23937.1 hypothetical protein CLV32_0223 [Pedobacter duraquae]
MDIQEEWDSLNAEFEHNSIADQIMLKKRSTGVYETTLKHLKYKLYWVFGLCLLPLSLALLNSGSLQVLLLGAFAAFLFAAVAMAMKLKSLPAQLNYSKVTSSLLKERIRLINEILRFERYWGYIFIPIAAPIGIIASRLVKRNDFSLVFNSDNWFYLVPVCVFLAVAGIFLGAKMNRFAFGTYLDKLREYAEQLS